MCWIFYGSVCTVYASKAKEREWNFSKIYGISKEMEYFSKEMVDFRTEKFHSFGC